MRRLRGSRLVRRVNFTLRGTLNGREVRVPVRDGIGLMDPPLWEQEPWLNGVLDRLLDTADGAFVDVGVNLGQSLLKVKTLRPSMRYVGFEPNPLCVAYVRALTALNGFQDVVVAPLGLSDHAAALSLFSRPDDATDSSATVVPGIYRRQSEWTQSPVAVLRGDEALAALNVSRVSVIKIDVEGAELEVVRGLRNTISTCRPSIICEVLPTYSGGDGRRAFREPRIQSLLEIMQTFDYELFCLLPDGDAKPLMTIEPHSDASLVNYAFLPAHAADALMRKRAAPPIAKCATA